MTNFPNDPFGGNYSSGTMYVQPGAGGYIDPPRNSLLAVISLVLGILGFLMCWVPVVGLVVGALVVFMSIGAILSVGASQGRKKGKGLAVAGFALGVVNVLIGVGCVIGMGMFGNLMAGYSKALTAAQASDASGFNAYMNSNAQATQAELDAFVASYQPTMGDFKEAPKSFMQVFKAFGSTAAMQEVGNIQQANAGTGRALQVLPVNWTFDKGEGIVVLVFDSMSKTPTAQMGELEDIVIVDKGTNTVVTRLSDVLAGGAAINPDGTLPVKPIPDFSQPGAGPPATPEAAPEAAPGSAPESAPSEPTEPASNPS